MRELNEDNYLADDRRGLWVVADGMGGYERGDYAAAKVVELLGGVRTIWPTPKSLALDILSRLEDAHVDLLAEGERARGGVVGSTVVCLAMYADHVLAIWCGDSRIYRLRRGDGLRRITRDHTIVQELVDAGRLAAEEAESHPESHVLTRGLGVEGAFDPDFQQLELRRGDRFILCSDGLPRVVGESYIAAIAERSTNPALCTASLLERALQEGAPDNVTVTTVDIDHARQF
ncbi:MAG: PP2C family serine/threonine-protein phosphatase [Paracoccaceae bacterium]